MSSVPYVELHVHTCFSLLEGASTPRELVAQAARQGHRVLAVTDRNNLYGAMTFAHTCRAAGIRPVIGVELTVATPPGSGDLAHGRPDGSDEGVGRRADVTLLAADRRGYANLCRLVSLANGWGLAEQADRERRRLDPHVALDQLREHSGGVVCLTGGRNGELAQRVTAGDRRGAEAALSRFVDWFGAGNVWVELHNNLVQGDRARNRALLEVANRVGVGAVATGCVHYHERRRHRLHDALCAVRHRTTLDACQPQRRPNSEFFLRSPGEQAARFADWPDTVANTLEVAERCTFDVTQDLGYRLPAPPVPEGHSPDSWLEHLCRKEIERHYGPDERPDAHTRLDEEVALINRHGLAGFFLVYQQVLDLAREVAAEVRAGAPRARAGLAPGRGRGSSVGSIVCYLIGLSHIDPVRNDLFLGRFLNEEMPALPDIDLDFPRDIRDRLFQRVHEHWGIDRAALVATFPRYRLRSAVRDLGKALGLPGAEVDRLAKLADGYRPAGGVADEMQRDADLASLAGKAGWRHLISLAGELAGFPRHVSQHPGGMVIASEPLIDCVPIQPTAWPGRYVCHWDKDDIDDAGMVKIDFLSLGMLSLVEECLDHCAHQHGGEPIDLARIDYDDKRVYDRIGKGDTIGVFQIESRAQAGILPRTLPRSLDDLTAQVAIIRPGPIVGGAVHRYVDHRSSGGDTGVPHPCLKEALGDTFGVVLFQEQVVRVAMDMGGFTAGEAEALRRAMGRKDWDTDQAARYRRRFLAGAEDLDVPRDVADRVFDNLEGFAQFGFPKSHATAFGLLAYQSTWLKEHHPAEFFCALYNNWPMGFYPPHVFTNDARRHGIAVLRPDINTSHAACTIEATACHILSDEEGARGAVRLGLTWIRSLGTATAAEITGERERAGPYRSLRDFVQRTGLTASEAIENAIRTGAFDGLGLSRRELLWQLWLLAPPEAARTDTRARQPTRTPTSSGPQRRARQLRLDLPTEQDHIPLAPTRGFQAMADDYELLGLSPTTHPMQFLRTTLRPRVRSAEELRALPAGAEARTAGMVVCRQRPGTAEGAVYLLLEDETGLINVTLSSHLYDRNRTSARSSPFLRISGVIEPQAGDVPTLRALSLNPIKPARPLSTPDGHNWA